MLNFTAPKAAEHKNMSSMQPDNCVQDVSYIWLLHSKISILSDLNLIKTDYLL